MSIHGKPGLMRLLRGNRRFRVLSLGLFVSRTGDMFTAIAIAWLTLSRAGPAQLGLVMACFGLPRVPMSPLAGYLLDRYPLRLLLVADNVGRGMLVLSLAVLSFTGQLSVAALYPVAALCGVLAPLTDVGENVFLQLIVTPEDLDTASVVLSGTWEASALLGPAVAGVLVRYGGYGPAFVLDSLTFAVMAAAATSLDRHRPAPGRSAGLAAKPAVKMPRLPAGFGAMAKIPGMMTLTAVSLGFLFLTGTLEAIVPAFAQLVLRTSASGLGLMAAAGGLGAVIGAFLVSPRFSSLSPRISLATALAGHGLLFLPFLLIRNVPVAAVVYFAAFSVGVVFYPLERSLSQRLVPAEMRARVFGARRAVTGSGYPLGAAAGGTMTVVLGAAHALVAVGLGMCVLAMAIACTSSLSWPLPPARQEKVREAVPGASASR